MPAPDLHDLSGGVFMATCGRCLRGSMPVPAPHVEHAWGELAKLGWNVYRSSERANAREYPICPKCIADPETIEDAVRAAKSRRKRK